MLKITYRVDGQPLSREQLPANIEQSLVGQIRRIVQQKVGQLRCPDHNENPRCVEVRGNSLETLSIHVEGCCDKLTQAAVNAVETNLLQKP
jgi:hypothetical protein